MARSLPVDVVLETAGCCSLTVSWDETVPGRAKGGRWETPRARSDLPILAITGMMSSVGVFTARAERRVRTLDYFTSIRVFRQVVESGSFVGAADRMELSTPMVSKHVMYVEKRVGVRLLNRNTRNLSLTEAGRLYFERCKAILEDLEQTEVEVGALTGNPRGTVRVSAPSWVAGQRVANLLADFQRRYPEIVVDLSFEDRNVDLVEEGYDLALRVASADSLSNTLIARAIRPMTFYLAASRDYVKKHGAPKTPEDLTRHAFVAVGSLNSLRLTGADGRTEVPVRVVLRYRSLSGVAHAVAAGIGIAPVPGIAFEDPLLKDVLVPVLEGNVVREATLYAVYVSRRHVPLKIRTLVDFLVASLSGVRDPRPVAAR